jgi:Mitochondrial carrier protein
MVRKIWASEGVVGFGRGIGAAIYGNYSCGFIYFVLYKWLKNNMPELGGFKALIAGFFAETVAILYKFPFDLVKCRLQSVNYIFKYANWSHGLSKEYKLNGVPGLYNGVFPYLLCYTTFTAMQFSIYE